MSKYEEFKKWYDKIEPQYQNILDNYMYRLEHNFEREDGAIAKHIKKYKGNMTYEELAEKANMEVDTLKKNILRGSKKMKKSKDLASALGKDEYELYYGEKEIDHQSRVLYDIEGTFKNQTEKMQDALIYLAMNLRILLKAPEFYCVEYDD